ncbi:hypothetical protein SAMN05444004_101518 [Jannaschia faecimaris]|uniref:Proteophosphoglycan n=1 Tax=Jannaschia faecimaris TaxID=1244108 RepID=A0A1H3K649_9RHOB|nr:DUF1285 domain-containing protein [Jannaschia faecimaris]SDY46994.1 hypothetical protein SAMN05444004_101518 [Jannaschia faecimaris]
MARQDHAPPSASNFLQSAQVAAKEGKRGSPPVESWDPPFCGDIDITIKRDGTWIHEGTPIRRPGLVKLFASILKREGDEHFLVTPVEKVRLQVEDAPFVAVDFEVVDGVITFVTNVGDVVAAGSANPIRVEIAEDGEPSPYVEVRRGLDALIDRKSFYRLVDIGKERDGKFGVASGDTFFPIVSSASL